MLTLIQAPEAITTWTPLGILAFLVVAFVGAMRWFLPKIVTAAENIAPTICREMQRQHDEHAKERQAAEERHAGERAEMLQIIAREKVNHGAG